VAAQSAGADATQSVAAPVRPTDVERRIKPAYLAAAAGLVVAIGLGAWAVLSNRTDPAATATQEAAGEVETADTGGALEPGSPPGPGSGASAIVRDAAQPRPEDGTRAEAERESAGAPATQSNAADSDLRPPPPAAPATPPGERAAARSADEAARADSRRAESPGAARETNQTEEKKPAPAPSPPPQTRAAVPPPVEQRPRSNEVSRPPLEQLPVAQPTAVVARPAPTDRPATAPTVAAAPPAPRVVPPPPPAAPAPDERSTVLATLARYRAAYESLDANAVAQVFVGVDRQELRRAFRQYKSMSVQIDTSGCETSIDGDRATATCNVTRVIHPKAGESVSRSQREVFHLRRAQQSWIVEQVR
jgi:hypothetical protein